MSHALGYTQATVGAAASGLTPPAGATRVLIDVETNPIRWRDDGTDPTAAVGVLIAAADPYFVYDGELSKFRMIRQGGADATVSLVYYQ